MTKVFVVQQPAYYDKEKRAFVAKYDLTPAAAFGELVFLLPPGNIFRDKLRDASKTIAKGVEKVTADDFVLAIGDPVAIGVAILAVGKITGGRVRLLKWDRLRTVYIPFEIVV